MIQKPEIQYVGQFYVYGSEAKEAERKAQRAEKIKSLLPKPKLDKVRKLYVDPVAMGGILVAMIILVVLAIGAVRLQESWDQYNRMERYLDQVMWDNAKVEQAYRSSFDMEKIRTTAEAMGMVPVSKLKVMKVRVTVPEPVKEPTAWDNFKWFVKGLVQE